MIHFLFLSICIFSLSVKANNLQNTGCYNYFLQKDNCVHASSINPCSTKNGKMSKSCKAFKIDPNCKAAQQNAALQPRLARRYDTTIPTLAVAGGFYNSTVTSGVCLWSGDGWVDSRNQPLSGWLNGTQTGNCNKQVYIQRQGQPGTVQYAPVLDGCGFNTQTPETGCFQIWMTIDLFDKFNPTQQERESFQIDETFTWDFVDGSNPI
ncbi:hypothetical protein DFH28DRAFT_1077997 [Melampsora americana]|nr:hypothetical protein DFH28DRAFT_1077997 [Melampsora americana]